VTPASPGFSGYVDVGALELYCERHGDGHPLVLLHGAFGTIESCFAGLLPALARHFEVIAVELQGHGRTRDIARPLTYPDMAADLAALLGALGIPRAHVAGYSMGAGSPSSWPSTTPNWSAGSCSSAARAFLRAAYIPSTRRHSTRSTRTSSTGHPGTRRTAGSRPIPAPGHRSSSS